VKVAVQPVKINQRVTVPDCDILDLTDKDGMIPAVVCIAKTTLQYNECIG
jgi:hypothetical protein